MENNVRIISNQADLEQYFSELCKDIVQVSGQVVSLEGYTQDPLVIKIAGGPGEESSVITASWMKTFLKLQDSVYSIFAIIKGEPLTPEEKMQLEVQVKVQSGCTEFLLALWKMFLEAAKDMTIPQILAFTVPIAAAYVGGVFLKGRDDRHKTDLDAQIEMKKLELHETTNREREEANIRVLEIVKEMVVSSEKAEKSVYRTLLEESTTSEVSVDGKVLSTPELKELAKVTRRPRAEVRTKVIEDHFIVSIMDFSDPSGTLINLKGTAPEHDFKGVIIPDDLLDDEELAIFAHAQGRTPMHLRLTVKDRRGVLSDPTLIQKIE